MKDIAGYSYDPKLGYYPTELCGLLMEWNYEQGNIFSKREVISLSQIRPTTTHLLRQTVVKRSKQKAFQNKIFKLFTTE
ncbi:hypothetical protein [Komagataeibacter nataicola]|uniref:hypothetical protein n=1 Tax=Komagataeibacter nataicola TaxID=265960 RepID=UPI0011B42B35|nr:hypothetical protein [Komagataeibacter nataicola]WNM07298.1 hypothetical protein RI056_00205 [Komagataeibacter nataicola]